MTILVFSSEYSGSPDALYLLLYRPMIHVTPRAWNPELSRKNRISLRENTPGLFPFRLIRAWTAATVPVARTLYYEIGAWMYYILQRRC